MFPSVGFTPNKYSVYSTICPYIRKLYLLPEISYFFHGRKFVSTGSLVKDLLIPLSQKRRPFTLTIIIYKPLPDKPTPWRI